MSERQAKLRKAEANNQEKEKVKKTKFEVITNVVLVVALAAIVGLGGWALVSHYSANKVTEEVQTTDTQAPEGQENAANAQQEVPTLAQYCEQNGTTPEEFAKEYGLELGNDLTADTLMSDAVNKLTLANYAKMAGMDIKTIREQLQVPEDVKDTDIMMDIFTKISEQQQAQAGQENENNNEN